MQKPGVMQYQSCHQMAIQTWLNVLGLLSVHKTRELNYTTCKISFHPNFKVQWCPRAGLCLLRPFLHLCSLNYKLIFFSVGYVDLLTLKRSTGFMIYFKNIPTNSFLCPIFIFYSTILAFFDELGEDERSIFSKCVFDD